MTLLRLVTQSGKELPKQIPLLLKKIVRENAILQFTTQLNALDALVITLRNDGDWTASKCLFDFLDDCIGRLVRRPIAYQDALDEIVASQEEKNTKNHGPVSLLLLPLVEQWPFLVKNKPEEADNVAEWLVRFSNALNTIHEDQTILSHLLQKLANTAQKDKRIADIFTHALKNSASNVFTIPHHFIADSSNEDSLDVQQDYNLGEGTTDFTISEPPPLEDENHPGLNRWMQKEVDEAIEEGPLRDLLLCLCSKHTSIRIQAFGNIQRFAMKLKVSAILQCLFKSTGELWSYIP